jgi:hypothetical protein
MRGVVSSISPPSRSLQQRPLAGLRRNVVREIPGRNVRERAPAAAAVRGAGARDFSRGSLGSRYDRRYGLAGRGVCLTPVACGHGVSSSGSRDATRRLGVGSGSGATLALRGVRHHAADNCRQVPAARLFRRERVAEATYLYMEDAQSSVPGRGRTRTVQGGLPRVFGDRLRALGCRDFPAEQ